MEEFEHNVLNFEVVLVLHYFEYIAKWVDFLEYPFSIHISVKLIIEIVYSPGRQCRTAFLCTVGSSDGQV